MPRHPPRDATISAQHCEAHAQEIIVICEFKSPSDPAYSIIPCRTHPWTVSACSLIRSNWG